MRYRTAKRMGRTNERLYGLCTRVQKGLLLSLLLIAWSSPAKAQGDDPLVTNPDVFIVFDTSGSMSNCADNCNRSRFTAAQEVLTGTFLPLGTTYYHPTGSCPNQDSDGILDHYKDFVRFGFGSFDDEYSCRRYGTDYDGYGDDPYQSSYRKGRGIKGRRDNSSKYDRCQSGRGCLIDVVDQDDPDDLLANNAALQDEICGMNYDQCTPIAGSLYDARHYFENYESEIGCQDPMGRHGGDCRPQYVLLMTDGQEYPPCRSCPESGNGDFCPQGHGGSNWVYENRCSWYGNEAIQAEALFKIGVPVYVVAFGDMDEDDRQRMHRIARAGMGMNRNEWFVPSDKLADLESGAIDEHKAFIVKEKDALKIAFSVILDSILAGSTSRTNASTEPSSSASGRSSMQYSAWFQMGISGITWQGYLARDEFKDEDGDGVDEFSSRHVAAWDHYDLDAKKKEQLAPLPKPENRRFLTIIEDPRSTDYWDATSGTYQLPRYENNGTKGLVPFKATSSSDSSWDFNTDIMCLRDTGEGYSDKQQARVIKAYVRGEEGIQDAAGLREAKGSQLGDIFHSSPVLVSRPAALNSDWRFEKYFQEYKLRHSMVYVGANDGLLHAFVGQDNNEDDGVIPPLTELWAFMPTHVLGRIHNIRSGGHNFFVDGSPVVRDVLFHNMDVPDGFPDTDECFKDVNDNCRQGAWRTVLIGGLRAGGDAYYALDVTDPNKPGYLWEYRTTLPVNDNDSSTTRDDPLAKANQCSLSAFQSRAKPLVGKVWLKTDESEYIDKSVAIVPGGYFPGLELSNISSCIQLLELVVAGSSMHVLDVETGQLMKKFTFSTSTEVANIRTILDQFYADLAQNPNKNWMNWAGGKAFSGEGWTCGEKRFSIDTAPTIPQEFLSDDYCVKVVNQGNIAYQRACCANGNAAAPKVCNNFNGNGNCAYRFTEYTDGTKKIELKTEGCKLVDKDERGRFEVTLAGDMIIESVAATPVGYDMSNDNFISRIFVVASNGMVYRVDMKNAQYDSEAAEGEQITAHSLDPDSDWKVSLWFDPTDEAFVNPPQPGKRLVTVSPALAINAERNLILYYGTGSVDNLNYSADSSDYFYAVTEVRDPNDPTSVADSGELVGVKNDFAPSERLFGKPLVVSGNVYFTTFTPDADICGQGQSRVYGLKYDDFDPKEAPMEPYVHPDRGIISSPVMRWTSSGPEVVVQQGEKIERLDEVPKLDTRAYVMHWGQVL